MTESEIRKLLREMKELDSERAFKRFYDMTYDRLFRIAYYYLHREELAQEAVLDVFLKLWQQREDLPALDNIEDYCFVLVKNRALNYIDKEDRRSSVLCSGEDAESGDVSSSPEESFISEELFARYVKALDRLPERCREVFILIREEGKTYAEVADRLGISVNTVNAQLQKASVRLKELLFRS